MPTANVINGCQWLHRSQRPQEMRGRQIMAAGGGRETMIGSWPAPGWQQASVEGSDLPGRTGWQLAAALPPLSTTQRGLYSWL